MIELELERYNELLKSEQELETLKELIFNNVKYASYKDDITIDDDTGIMEYLKVIETDTFLELYMMLKLHENMKSEEEE